MHGLYWGLRPFSVLRRLLRAGRSPVDARGEWGFGKRRLGAGPAEVCPVQRCARVNLSIREVACTSDQDPSRDGATRDRAGRARRRRDRRA